MLNPNLPDPTAGRNGEFVMVRRSDLDRLRATFDEADRMALDRPCMPMEFFGAMGRLEAAIIMLDVTSRCYAWPETSREPATDQGDLAVASVAVERVIRAARSAVESSMDDFSRGNHLPRRTEHAMARLDDAVMALETITDVPDREATDEEAIRWADRLALFNAERTDEPGRFCPAQPMWGYE